MKKWSILEKGDSIDLIAPGYGSSQEAVEGARHAIQSFGLQARIPATLVEQHPLGYAQTESYRACHLQSVLSAPETTVIWALQGGRGTSSLFRHLQNLEIPAIPKLIVGFSDITALHLLANRMQWPSLHGIVLASHKEANTTVNGKASLQEVMDILTGKVEEVRYRITPLNPVAKFLQTAIKAPITGGNLSLVQRSIGTSTNLDAQGKILFLEDIGEEPTGTYESLVHLDRAGTFKGIKALIFGNFTACLENEENIGKYQLVREEIGNWMESRNIPVFYSDHFGHGDYNYPLPFNTPATLTASSPKESLLSVKTNN